MLQTSSSKNYNSKSVSWFCISARLPVFFNIFSSLCFFSPLYSSFKQLEGIKCSLWHYAFKLLLLFNALDNFTFLLLPLLHKIKHSLTPKPSAQFGGEKQGCMLIDCNNKKELYSILFLWLFLKNVHLGIAFDWSVFYWQIQISWKNKGSLENKCFNLIDFKKKLEAP